MRAHNIVSVVFVPARNTMYLACGRNRAAFGHFYQYELFPKEQ